MKRTKRTKTIAEKGRARQFEPHKAVCEQCGKTFMKCYPWQKFCRDSCRIKFHNARRVEANRKTPKIAPDATKKCEFCGKEYTPKTSAQKYCSRSCVVRAGNARAKENRKPKIKNCLHCGKPFEVKPPAIGRKYCCAACQKKHYALRHVKEDFKHGKIWVLTPCSSEDPEKENLGTEEKPVFYKWILEER